MAGRQARSAAARLAGESAGRERIIESVLGLLRTTEATDLTLAAICAAAGVTSGAVYFHFADKDAAIEAAVVRAIERKFQPLARLDGAPLDELIAAIVRVTSERHRQDRKIGKAIQLVISTRPAAYSAWLEHRTGVTRLLEQAIGEARMAAGLTAEPARYLAHVILNAIEDLAMDAFQWRNPHLQTYAARKRVWNATQSQLWAWAALAPMEDHPAAPTALQGKATP